MNYMSYIIHNRSPKNSDLCDHLIDQIDKSLQELYELTQIGEAIDNLGKPVRTMNEVIVWLSGKTFYPQNSIVWLAYDKVKEQWILTDTLNNPFVTTADSQIAKLGEPPMPTSMKLNVEQEALAQRLGGW